MANFTFVPAFFQQHGEGSVSYGNGKTLDVDAAITAGGGTYSTENQAIINAIRQLIHDQPGRFIEGIGSLDQTVLLPPARATASIVVGGKRLSAAAAQATATMPVAGGVTPQIVFVNAGQATARFPVPSQGNFVVNLTAALAGAFIPGPAYPGVIPGMVLPGEPGPSITIPLPPVSAVARGNDIAPSAPGEDIDAIPATDLYPDTNLLPYAPTGVSTSSPFYPGPTKYPAPDLYPSNALVAARAIASGGVITSSGASAITINITPATATASAVPAVPGLKPPAANATASNASVTERYDVFPVVDLAQAVGSSATFTQATSADLNAYTTPALVFSFAQVAAGQTGTLRLLTSTTGTSGWTVAASTAPNGAGQAYCEVAGTSVSRYVKSEWVNDATAKNIDIYTGLSYFGTPGNQVAVNVPVVPAGATASSAGVTAAWDVQVAIRTTTLTSSSVFTAVPTTFYDLESGANPVPTFVFFRVSVTSSATGEVEVMSNTTASTSGAFVLDAKSLPSGVQTTSSTQGLSVPSPTNSANLKRFVAGALRNQTANMTGVDARLFLAYRK